MALGAGLGFASISPWSYANPSATTVGVMAVVWLLVTQWLSSAFGGYLAGRLRKRWAGLHADESTFRDTAHGVLAWALATLLVFGLLSVAASTAAGVAATAGAAAAGGGAVAAASMPPAGGPAAGPGAGVSSGIPYLTDGLFRADHPVTTPPELRAEAGRILLTATQDSGVSDPDKTYLAQQIAATTGVDQATAKKRVDDAIAQVQKTVAELKQKADQARKAASAAAFATAFSLLIGAFIAGAAGALGGHHRDDYAIPLAT